MAAKTLEERLQRVEDILEIQKIMGIYPYYGMANMHSELMKKIWSKNQPDIRIYLGEQGYWEGPDALKRVGLIADSPEEEKEIQEKSVGMMAMHCPVCPVIEVAGDGKTAKGVWIGLGLLAMKDRETGEPTGAYEWDKYGIDFIKEDGKWKVWHQHIYRLLHGMGYDEKWTDQFNKPEPDLSGRGIEPPDGPAIDDNPYRPDTVQRLIPKPPEPYETWEDTTMY